LSLQQLADTFIQSRKDFGYCIGRRSASVIKELGKHLVENGYTNAFTIVDENYVVGPYVADISAFVDFKKSCGFKYHSAEYHLKVFDAFCAAKENESLTPQHLAEKWVLKRDGEHPNTRSGRVGPVRVFGKYLTSIGHPRAFAIPDDVAQGKAAEPPYLFSGFDIDMFFSVCADLQPEEKDPCMHIVLPAAYLFMHCMGVRTCELEILMENVDFDTGEVVIVDAKTGDRVIYMSDELSKVLSKYSLKIEDIFPHRKYLFPASENRSRKDFAKHFREIWESSVPAEGRGVPRLYDFRHHLLYRNVELCMRNGNDVNVLQPYIMRHMGHKLPESFQYYFHLSPPIQKEVSEIKNSLDWMIPDVPEVPYE
jgi:integrase